MSTSLLYHAFGVRGYRYCSTEYSSGAVIFHIRHNPHSLHCPVCSHDRLIRRGTVPRKFRLPSIGKRPVFVILDIQRVYCPLCDIVRQVSLNFADSRNSYTHAFARYVLELSRHMTIKDVATHLNVSWDVVKAIQKHYLLKHYSRPSLKAVRRIAIDEIAIRKGHSYLTVVLDLETGHVLFVGDGKGVETLIPFFKRLRRAKANIEAVAIDMSPAFHSAVRNYLPQATVVFDHFHIIKLFNDKLSQYRRKLQQEATGQEKKVMKGTRWLLLKNPENLDPERDEQKRLDEALRLNEPLAIVYYMKEDLRQIWHQENKQDAEKVLNDWAARARASTIPMLIKFANTLMAHRSGILAYYDYPISTGPLEGTNNKIKTMKRQAYGFRDHKFFKLKIYALHETKYALVG